MGTEGGARRVFEKVGVRADRREQVAADALGPAQVFNEDINRLLQMKEMWTVPGRVKPTPLDYDAIMDGTFVLPPLRQTAPAASGSAAPTAAAAKDQSGLRDQQELSLKENLVLFLSRCEALAERLVKDPSTPLAFDKDDDETLDFVCATSNLRSFAYGIEPQTRFKVKGTSAEGSVRTQGPSED
jgi:ubiquitin-like 1-activating enzyme E1 B